MTFSIGFGFQFASETLPMRRASGGKRSKRLRGEPAARNAMEEAGRKALRSALGAEAPVFAYLHCALATVTNSLRLQARGAQRIGRGPIGNAKNSAIRLQVVSGTKRQMNDSNMRTEYDKIMIWPAIRLDM
jgi:hypothetical protein